MERRVGSLNENCVRQRQNPDGVYLRSVTEMCSDVRELYHDLAYQRRECDRMEAALEISEVKEETDRAEPSEATASRPSDPRAKPYKRKRTVDSDPYLTFSDE